MAENKRRPTETFAELFYISCIITAIIFLPAGKIFGRYPEHKTSPAVVNAADNKTALINMVKK